MGKCIVVTGAARGIGQALVKELAQSGEHTLIAISRNKEGLAQLEADVKASGTYIYSIAADLTNDYLHALAEIRRLTGRVDVLVNNAGVLINKKLHETTDADIERILHTNYTVPVKLIRDLLPLMGAGAHIVNIGSMGGYQGSSKFAGLSIYSASKGALAVFSECMAEELKEQNIAVNCLALGSVQTEMLAEAFPGYEASTGVKQMAEWIAEFSLEGNKLFNGKVLPVSVQTP
jgi:NAD(P)-dependent dehydrogenase (short-subunit alcohol dehydrogenase family)